MGRLVLTAATLLLMALAFLSALASHVPFLAQFAAIFPDPADLKSHHALLFLLAQIGVAALGFLPASLLAIAAGATYGFAQGFALSSTGLLIGGSLSFLLSRSILRPWIEKWATGHPHFVRLEQALQTDGWRFVCLVRMSPVMPFALTSYCLGLTTIDHRSFLLGTLASLPSLACFIAIGALGHAGWQATTSGINYLNITLLTVGIAATMLITWRIRYFIRRASGDLPTAEN